jgi:hypothetical protein
MDRADAATQQKRLLPRLKTGFVVLVAVSAALIASYAGGSLQTILAALGGGTLMGLGLVWLAFPDSSENNRGHDRTVNRR